MTMPSISSQTPPLPTLQSTGNSVVKASAASASDAASVNATATANGSAATNATTDSQQLTEAIAQVQDFTQSLAKELTFDIDDDSGRTVVKVIDTSTNEVLRQIPSEEMLGIAKALDQIQGLLIKQKA